MSEKKLNDENIEEEILNGAEQEKVSEETLEEEVVEETPDEKIAKLQLEIQEWKNSYTRKLAEFQNFTKRKENEVSEIAKLAQEYYRQKGEGRPTKKDRRAIDNLFNEIDDDDDFFDD